MRIGFPGTGTAGRHLRPEVARPEHEVPPEPDMMDQGTAELAYRRGPASTLRCCGTGRAAS
jgi:hypothetical protein